MAISFFPTNSVAADAIGRYNSGLTQEAVARMQADAAMQEAELRNKYQQQALQQNAQQQAQAQQLERERLQQQSQYQNGALVNQRAQTEAQMALSRDMARMQGTESEADRANRLKIAEVGAGARSNANQPSPYDIQEANNRVSALANRYQFQLDGIHKQLADEEASIKKEYDDNLGKFTPFTLDSTFKAGYEKKLADAKMRHEQAVNQLIQKIPATEPVDFQGGRFVPKLFVAPSAAGAPSGGFFGGAPTASVTGIPATGGFNPNVAAPSVQPVAPTADANFVTELQNAKEAIQSGKNPQAVAQIFKQRVGREMPAFSTGSSAAPAPVPPPAETVPVATRGQSTARPGWELDKADAAAGELRKLLSTKYGTVNIGKSPLTNAFGWSKSDIPAITKAVLAAEQGQPLRDNYGNTLQLTPEQIDQAKAILYSIAQ